jgi:hypothetical protein
VGAVSPARRPTHHAPLVPSGPFDEHPHVRRAMADLAKRTFAGGASSTLFLPQRGVQFQSFAFAYRTGLPKEMNIKKKPAGPLRGTVIVNISGHATGGIVDRVVAFAHEELSARNEALPADALELVALRNACDTAHRAFASDPQRTRSFITIEVPGRAPITLTRVRYDSLLAVVLGSADYWKGNAMLRASFAATNTYHLRARTPDGTVLERHHVPRNDPSALEIVTRIPIELPEATGTFVLQAWPAGSAEVGGYREAREYTIHVGGDYFSVDRQSEIAEKYAALHPEIRWDTVHEADDLERLDVAPAPFPYVDF